MSSGGRFGLQKEDEVLAPIILVVGIGLGDINRVAEMRPSALPVLNHPGSLPKINLQLVARRTFHPAKRQLRPVRQLAHKTFDRIIPAGERVGGDQFRVNALGRKSRQQTVVDHCRLRGTLAGSSRFGPGGHKAGFEAVSSWESMGGMAGFETPSTECK
jgi:hypothetical protein